MWANVSALILTHFSCLSLTRFRTLNLVFAFRIYVSSFISMFFTYKTGCLKYILVSCFMIGSVQKKDVVFVELSVFHVVEWMLTEWYDVGPMLVYNYHPTLGQLIVLSGKTSDSCRLQIYLNDWQFWQGQVFTMYNSLCYINISVYEAIPCWYICVHLDTRENESHRKGYS